MDTLNGLIKIIPVKFGAHVSNMKQYIDDVNEKKEVFAQSETVRIEKRLFEYFRAYDYSKIPWYMRVPVFVFGNAHKNIDCTSWSGSWEIMNHVQGNIDIKEKRFSKYQESFEKSKERLDNSSTVKYIIRKRDSFGYTSMGYVKVKYPIIVKTLENCVKNNENELYISLENYNLLLEYTVER